MIIGYARVSTQDQNLYLQKDALKKAGCEKIFTDKSSGIKTARPGLEKVLNLLKKGDCLVVWKMDRLGRSLKHLIEVITNLKDKGIGFKSIQENIDTMTSSGKLIFHIFGALAEFERDLILERTYAGLKAARARGRVGGRPKVMNESKLELALELMDDPNYSVKKVCETLNISKSTLYNYLNSPEAEIIKQKPKIKKIKVNLWLRVERNNKFVRGMKKTRQEIENNCLSAFDMEKPDPTGWEYYLTIPYKTDQELNEIIDELFYEMERTADYNNCFTEADIWELNGDRSW